MSKIEGGRRLDLLRQIRDDGESYGLQLVRGSKIPRGSVYVTLGRLEGEGLIRSHRAAHDPRLKLYCLTETGEAALGATEAALRAVEKWEAAG